MIRLFKNYYTDKNPRRAAELNEVRRRDEANRFLAIHAIDGRPTFTEIFRAVNEVTGPDDLCVIANADISFDATIALAEQMQADEAYALTRWEETARGVQLFADANGTPRIDAQDAWIFRGQIREALIADAGYQPGTRGADNALAAAMGDAGYRVSNPSKSIKAIHLHRSGVRHYSKLSPAVPKPYLCIPPHELGETPELRWNRETEESRV